MTEHDIDRMMQCVTCSCDPQKCGCTEADEDANGMCVKWQRRKSLTLRSVRLTRMSVGKRWGERRMKKIIAIEMNTDDGGYIEVAGELIQCKDCKYYDGRYCHHKGYGDGYAHYTPPIKSEEGFCDWADKEEEE